MHAFVSTPDELKQMKEVPKRALQEARLKRTRIPYTVRLKAEQQHGQGSCLISSPG
jgi:hypothetical protein